MRLFIAVRLPKKIKNKIRSLAWGLKKASLPKDVRFLSDKNWHITLTFLGEQQAEALGHLKESIKELDKLDKKLDLNFNFVGYGPCRFDTKRMIWIMGDEKSSTSLNKLKEELEKKITLKGVRWRKNNTKLNAHITVARFQPRKISRLPSIEKKLDWHFLAKEINLMESTLKITGAEYRIITSKEI